MTIVRETGGNFMAAKERAEESCTTDNSYAKSPYETNAGNIATVGAMKLIDPARKIKNIVMGMTGNTIILTGKATKETTPDMRKMSGRVNI